MSRNLVILVGNLGRDPELSYMPNGQAMCKFSMATTERFKGRDGNLKEETTWHNIIIFGKSAEYCGKLRKGQSCFVEGRIQNREYEKNGEKRRVTEILAQRVEFFGGRDATES